MQLRCTSYAANRILATHPPVPLTRAARAVRRLLSDSSAKNVRSSDYTSQLSRVNLLSSRSRQAGGASAARS